MKLIRALLKKVKVKAKLLNINGGSIIEGFVNKLIF